MEKTSDDVLIHSFANLFPGRRDAWGHVEGRCVVGEITDEMWHDHLYGEGSLGIYPLTPLNTNHTEINQELIEFMVGWGATDIDRGDDMLVLAKNIHAVWKHFGVVTWIERSKGKGYHVLVFPDDDVTATTMRNAWLVVHQIAGVPATEIYPKQTVLTGAGYGNYLNLPYAASWVAQGKRVVLDPQTWLPMSLTVFVDAAYANLASAETLRKIAAMYKEPVKPELVRSNEPYSGSMDGLTKRMSSLAWTIFRDGPLPGADRSKTLAHLANLLAEEGYAFDEALALLTDADARWGKFHDRPDGERRLSELLARSYA